MEEVNGKQELIMVDKTRKRIDFVKQMQQQNGGNPRKQGQRVGNIGHEPKKKGDPLTIFRIPKELSEGKRRTLADFKIWNKQLIGKGAV